MIVKDMMLTGFDAPPLHTLYLDRPLKGALLMQTLARVNRTFRGKQDGLLVAYAPLAENLDKALAEYTETDRTNKPVGRNVDEAVGADQRGWSSSSTRSRRLRLAGQADKERPAGLVQGRRPALANYLRSPGDSGQPADERPRTTLARRQVPQAGEPARPGVGAVASGRETLADLLAGGAVLRGGPRLDGEVRRRRAAGRRRAGARGDPATALRPRRDLHDDRRGPRHLRGGRDAEAVAV